MRILVTILLSLFLCSAEAQQDFPAIKAPIRPLLIVKGGESNGDGIAANSDATSEELAPRNLKILNNTALEFEPLDIGTNNLLGHYGLEAYLSTGHGSELQLANRYDDGDFGERTVYVATIAQGGSLIAHWDEGEIHSYSGSANVNLWQTAKDRVGAAIAEITAIHGIAPEIIYIHSQGINDYVGGTNAATWKSKTIDFFNRVRTEWGSSIKIYDMGFEFIASNPYAAKKQEIASEMTGVVVIPTTGLTGVDAHHLDYASFKIWTDDLIDTYLGL